MTIVLNSEEMKIRTFRIT